jgi:hypothetical protein
VGIPGVNSDGSTAGSVCGTGSDARGFVNTLALAGVKFVDANTEYTKRIVKMNMRMPTTGPRRSRFAGVFVSIEPAIPVVIQKGKKMLGENKT